MFSSSKLSKSKLCLLVGLATFIAFPSYAAKPDNNGQQQEELWKKKGHNKQGNGAQQSNVRSMNNEKTQTRETARQSGPSISIQFNNEQRSVVRNYFSDSYKAGRCPPGLSKKHNGCMPPGQAKKWQIGHRLPRDVTYYDLPPSVTIQLGNPPSGYKYVRVAGDILLMAVGTGMIMDAIQDLNGL